MDLGHRSSNVASGRQSTLAHLARSTAESLFATFFPAECRLCNTALINVSRLPVCPDCIASIKSFSGTQCRVCGELVVSAHAQDEAANPLCGFCRRVEASYVRAVSRGPYDGTLRDLIHLLKYQRVQPAADRLGAELAKTMQPLIAEAGSDGLVIPVPLHRSKSDDRGFNQAEEIARVAVKLLGTFRLEARVLFRTRPTTSQTGLTRHQRRANIRGAFEVHDTLKIACKNVIVVDDVMTTGTTAEECARVLRKAGAAKVWIATVARVSKLESASITVHPINHTAVAAAAGN